MSKTLLDFFQVRKKAKIEQLPTVSRPLGVGSRSSDGTESVRTIKKRNPQCFLSWNLNGLISRIKCNDWISFGNFLKDVVCLQEIKLPAWGNESCVKGDGKPRHRDRLKDTTRESALDADCVRKALSVVPYDEYDQYWSLSDWKYAGTLVLVRKDIGIKSVRYSLEGKIEEQHDPDGRVIVVEFEDVILLATYAPNHGWDQISWSRRMQWDDKMFLFLTAMREKKLIWMGDLNVAPTEMDRTHSDWFKRQRTRSNSNSNRRSLSSRSVCSPSLIVSEHQGQPGVTEYETKAFNKYLAVGDLIDWFRERQYPDGPPKAKVTVAGGSPYKVDPPHFSWRGSPGVDIPDYGRYYAKGMRIDHALVSRRLEHQVVSIEIMGYDRTRVDHCPVILKLNESDEKKVNQKSDDSVN